jgi:hypothetical protein
MATWARIENERKMWHMARKQEVLEELTESVQSVKTVEQEFNFKEVKE